MAVKNDERIMALKSQIESRRKELNGKSTTFVPTTNCLLELDGVKYNLHVNSTVLLLVKLNSLRLSAVDLDIPIDDVVISGYPLNYWIEDVRNNLSVQCYKSKKQNLDKLEKELTALLSDDKQIELKIDELEKLLQ